MPLVGSKRGHLGIGEAETLVKARAQRSGYHEVVEVREDGLLRDALHPGEAGKGQRLSAVFERPGEPALEEGDHLAVEPAIGGRVAGHDRRIVLVYEHHRIPAMMDAQAAGEEEQRAGVVVLGSTPFHQAGQERLLGGSERRALEQVPMPEALLGNRIAERPVGLGPGVALGSAKAQIDDRICPLMLAPPASIGVPHRSAFEQRGA